MTVDTSVFVWLFILSAAVTSMIGSLLWIHTGKQKSLYTVSGFDVRVEQGDSSDCVRHRCQTEGCSCSITGILQETCVLVCTEHKRKYRAVGTCRLVNTLNQTAMASVHTTNYMFETPGLALSHRFSRDSIGHGEYFIVQGAGVVHGFCDPADMIRCSSTTESFQEKRHRLIVTTVVFGCISLALLCVGMTLVIRQYRRGRSPGTPE